MGWLRSLHTSTLVFDIAQFFSSLNYQLLPIILNKADFDSHISFFFSDHLVNRQIQYIWNSFVSPFFKANIGIEKGSTLSLIFSVIYIASIFHIFEKRTKYLLLPIQIVTLSFVDDGLLISQEKSYEKSNMNIFCSYNIISSLFTQFYLIIEHGKSKFFHFSRLRNNINLLLLDLHSLGGSLLYLKDIWKYHFFFDKKLLFWHYVHYYANKALLTIKDMKMLGNLNRGVISYTQISFVQNLFLIHFFIWFIVIVLQRSTAFSFT